MAINNDVIDLSAAFSTADVYLAAASLNGVGTLVLEMTDGVVHTVDMTTLMSIIAAERGGLNWDPATAYIAGDVVSSGVDLYIATVNNTGAIPTANPATWFMVGGDAEKGGLEWDPAVDYNPGDIVSYNGDIYIMGAEPVGTAPGSAPIAAERGGIGWDTATTYLLGDTASEAGLLYMCLATNTGLLPSISPAQWAIASGGEQGGVAWKNGIEYKVGDIITNMGVGYSCLIAHTSPGAFVVTPNWSDAYIMSNVDPGTY